MNTQPNTPASRNEEAVPFGYIADFEWGLGDSKSGIYRIPNPERGVVVPVYLAAPRAALAAPGAAIDAREQEAGQNPRFTMQEWVAHARKHRWRFDQSAPAEGAATAAEHEGMTIAGNGASMLGALMREQRASRLGVYPDGNPNVGATEAAAPSEALSPPTVAQPVTEDELDAIESAFDYVFHFAKDPKDGHIAQNICDTLQRLERRLRGAQSCASQGCGGAVPHELLERIADRLHKAQIFFLAAELRAALSTAKSVEHGATDGGTGE